MCTEQQTAKRKLKREIGQLIGTVRECFKTHRFLPGLILLYASIDIMASLDRPEQKEDVSRADFISWVDKYMLPRRSLQSSAVDLYAARCGLLHTFTPESRLSREGAAREVYYAWGNAKVDGLEESMRRHWNTPAVTVHINELLKAVERGFEKFRRALGNDPTKANRVYARAAKFFGPISTDLVSLSLHVPRE